MSKQNPRVQIEKAAWTMVEGIKDAVSANLVAASKQLDIKGDSLARLMTLINASIDEGYHRGSKSLSKQVDVALVNASLPPLETPQVKKKSG